MCFSKSRGLIVRELSTKENRASCTSVFDDFRVEAVVLLIDEFRSGEDCGPWGT